MRRPSRSSAALLAAVLVLALGACGDDDDSGGGSSYGSKSGQADTATTESAPAQTGSATGTETGGGEAERGGAAAPSDSPEDQEGGAGDEVPASSQALITGDGGKLSPRTVHVPPFIAIRVQLRSADGGEYELTGGGKSVEAGGEIESAATTFEGLRAGRSLVLSGPQGKVTVVADAEPGP